MRRTPALAVLLTALLVPAGLAACSGGGSISSPTSRPSINLPTVELPSVALPTRPTATPPPETVTKTETRTETATATATQTQTQTATETQTVTATPSATEAPSPSATPTPTPEAAPPGQPDDGGTTWWPWLLLALVALGALARYLIRRSRAQAEVRDWDERLAAAELEASWVEDSLAAQVLSGTSTAEAQAIWSAAQPRLLEADATFHNLTTTAPDAARAERATDVRGLLRGLVEAVGADLAAPPGAGPDQFRARRAVVDSARRELRTTLGPVSRQGDPAADD
ncbi:hypothetical protein [Terrabacter sp. C0L_2]|uniref:hypothetical protein n=1 Tax=Terrabacter sp. C0L_2 TaxID=3108389 RepID=UPI002ED494BE|nr:hypothetical protein U5C87_00460 [Terrabacter sp. C0L_2]